MWFLAVCILQFCTDRWNETSAVFKWYAVSAAAACRNGESPAKEKHPLFKRIGGTCLYEQLLFHVYEHCAVRHLSFCTALWTLPGIRNQKDPEADRKNGGGVDLGHMPWSSGHSAVCLCLSSQCKSGHCGGRGTELLQHCTLPENDPRIFPDTSDDERLDSTWNGDRRSCRCVDALYVKKKESGKLPAEDRICCAAYAALYSVWRKNDEWFCLCDKPLELRHGVFICTDGSSGNCRFKRTEYKNIPDPWSGSGHPCCSIIRIERKSHAICDRSSCSDRSDICTWSDSGAKAEKKTGRMSGVFRCVCRCLLQSHHLLYTGRIFLCRTFYKKRRVGVRLTEPCRKKCAECKACGRRILPGGTAVLPV